MAARFVLIAFSMFLSMLLLVPAYAQLQPDSVPSATTTDGPRPSQPASPPYKKLLKGSVTYVVPRGTPMKLKLASVPIRGNGFYIEQHDINGNLPPARLGDVITAKTTEDLYVDDDKVIPEGTIFHGRVSKILPPRRASRPGSLEISFDEFTEPDGRKFAFRAEANNKKESTLGTKAHGFGIVAAYAGGGAIVGAMVAYQIFGMSQTIAMHGYNIAGGAALGAVAATAYAIMKKGMYAYLEPGEDLNVQLDTDMLLPAAVEPTAKKDLPSLDGLQIEVLKSKVKKDGLDGYNLSLEALVTNNTDERLKSIDLFLEDDNGRRFPVTAGLEDDAELIFDVDPHSMRRLRFNFQIEYPKLKRKLVWLQHKTHKELIVQKLP